MGKDATPQGKLTSSTGINFIAMRDFKTEGLKMLLNASEDLNKEYERELRRLRIKNLKIKLDMEVLVSQPDSKAADIIRRKHQGHILNESILHYN